MTNPKLNNDYGAPAYDEEEDLDMDEGDEKLADCQSVLEDTIEQLQTLRMMVVELLTDLVRNGFVDDMKGEIESRCDPVILRQLADYVGVEI